MRRRGNQGDHPADGRSGQGHILLADFRKKRIDWPEFERRFVALTEERRVAEMVERRPFTDRAVLLCSEEQPERCHRRLAARRVYDDIPLVAERPATSSP